MPDKLPYRVVFAQEAADFLLALPKRRRRLALALVKRLGANPFAAGDYSQPDESGRDIRHVQWDGFLFAFWPDHAMAELRIVEIDDAS